MPTRFKSPTVRHSRCKSSRCDDTIEELREELRKERAARIALEERVEKLLCTLAIRDELHQKEIWKLEKDITERDEKLETANKQLAWFRKKMFGRSSETSLPPDNETEDEDSPEGGESSHSAEESGKRNRGQQKGSKGHGRTNLTGLPEQDEPVRMPHCKCDTCGKTYRELSKTENSPAVELFAFMMLVNYRRSMYVPDCDCEGGTIRTAPSPAKAIKRSRLANSVWIHLVVQKFLHGVPTNRTLKDFSLKGLNLAQGTVTGGFKKLSTLIEPLYEKILNRCRGGEYWNADETTWRVFGSENQKWWFWLVASEDAVVYLLDQSRSGDVPDEFFAGSAGTLMTDRYSAYKGLHAGIKKAWCWVHVRRDFLKIFDGVKKLRVWAKEWLTEISKLFVLNEQRFRLWAKGLAFGDTWEKAQSDLSEHLKKMEKHWQDEVGQIGLPKEKKKVLRSLKRHWQGLTLFLTDPRVPLHNNRAERLLRNTVIMRKNSYGSGAQWSGDFAARALSIFQTWLVNGLNPEALLLDYFKHVSDNRPPPNLDQFLPWSMTPERKRQFALPKSFSRPG